MMRLTEPEFYRAEQSGIRIARKGGWKDGIISVGGFHSWDDWGMYWKDIVVEPPETELYTVVIPGRHGVLDLSEVLTGSPVFHNRKISATFYRIGTLHDWQDLYSNILYRLHGRTVQLIFGTEPEYYYEGRCTVSSAREDGIYSSFEIVVDAYPFKFDVCDSICDWLWDPFNFENGVIREYGSLMIPESGTLSVQVIGSAMDVTPIISASAVCTMQLGKDSYELKIGENTPIQIGNETYTLTFTGDAGTKISVAFRGGRL